MNDRPRGLGRGLSALLGEPAPLPAPLPLEQPPYSPPAPSAFEVGAVVHSFPTPTPPPAPPEFAPAPAPLFGAQPPAQPAYAPEAPAAPPEEQGAVVARAIPIELIQRNPLQPRKQFGETELGELADSIRAHGVLQPILVRPAAGQPGRYEIVAGERRWRAAQRAGLVQVPAVVQDLDEREVLEIGIIENVQRADLNPIEEAQGYQALIDRFGRTQQEIAEVVGKSRPHIANMLRMLSLPEEVRDMVRDGRLTAGHARALVSAPNPVELARLAIAQALNVREIERMAAQSKEDRDGPRVRAGAPGPAPEKDPDTRALEIQISELLGAQVTIQARGDAGEVRIVYRTMEQLDDICRRLSAS